MTKTLNYKYSWIPDIPDHRDYRFAVRAATPLPPKLDIRNESNVPVDQGNLGSCTGNAIASCDYFVQVKENLATPLLPSRLAIYYGERVIEGTVGQDAGAMIRDGFKVLANTGAASEKLWPYTIAKFTSKPVAKYFTEAKKHKAIQYQRLNNANLVELKQCLADGFPFVFGFSVYESFESSQVAKTGIVPMPKKSEQLLGGHAVLCVGYNDSAKRFLVQNSWGASWGQKGFFTIPYGYLTDTNLADDFWTLRTTA